MKARNGLCHYTRQEKYGIRLMPQKELEPTTIVAEGQKIMPAL
jgi:hypothetical protein